jgi:hypothetical protein
MSFGHWLGNAVKTAGKPLSAIGHELQKANGALKKEVTKIPFVGKPLFAAMDLGFIGTFGPMVATADALDGKRIDKAVIGQLKQEMTDIHEVAPYAEMVISLIPGIGPGVSAAIAGGLALAAGEKLSDALMDAVAAAIPGGAIAKVAFDMAKAGVKMAQSGKKVTWEEIAGAGINVVGDLVDLPPLAKNAMVGALDTAGQLARGVKPDIAIGDGAADVLSTYIPKAATAAIKVGIAVTHAAFLQKTQEPQLTHPTFQNKLMAVGQAVQKSDSTVMAARQNVPAESKRGFDMGVGLMRHQVDKFQFQTVRQSLPLADQHGFDHAVSLHIGRVGNPPPTSISSTRGQAAYFTTMGMQGAEPLTKQAIMSNIVNSPVAKIGAGVAVDHITDTRTGIWNRIVNWFEGTPS